MPQGEMLEAGDEAAVEDVDVVNAPKLLLGDSAVTEIAICLTLNDEVSPAELREYITHPDQFDEAVGKLCGVLFMDYDGERDVFYRLEESPVGESMASFCREMWRKQKELLDAAGSGDGGQIDSMLVRLGEERVVRFNGERLDAC